MALLTVPDALKMWADRADPHTRIILDYWDSEAEQYCFHDPVHPDHHGDISPHVLETSYRRVGSTMTLDHAPRKPNGAAGGPGSRDDPHVSERADPSHSSTLHR